MQWSPNGKLLATGSKDCTVIVWNFDPVALKLSHYKVPVLPYRTVLFSFHSWLLCRLHTAMFHWPLSSTATKEVQGPDTT